MRTGLPTLRAAANLICIVVPKFFPRIRKAFPGNTALFAAMDAVVLACATLVIEADLVLPIGD